MMGNLHARLWVCVCVSMNECVAFAVNHFLKCLNGYMSSTLAEVACV